ncbi:MAG: hypothetical protein QOG96_2152 [Pseudonocardiales bacterium]|nr:hypothetical protein [Pseudonocardia sp.]MDT7607649.1 hypothetical protein [Pseudonocardiales bacterium]
MIALHRMPFFPYSAATYRVSAFIPPLAVV